MYLNVNTYRYRGLKFSNGKIHSRLYRLQASLSTLCELCSPFQVLASRYVHTEWNFTENSKEYNLITRQERLHWSDTGLSQTSVLLSILFAYNYPFLFPSTLHFLYSYFCEPLWSLFSSTLSPLKKFITNSSLHKGNYLFPICPS